MNFTARMPPNHQFMLNSLPMEPVSRTYQYRKIMKPMLERKRRARINKCLDELKDLMTGTLQADGENVSKLEKADILELTVRHLQRLREKNALFVHQNETMNMDKFWAGFQHCATEVAQFLNKYDQQISGQLIQHITNYVPNIRTTVATSAIVTASAPALTSASAQPATPRLTTNFVVTRSLMNRELTTCSPRIFHKTPMAGMMHMSPTNFSNGGCGENLKRNRYVIEREFKREIMEENNNVWRPW